MASFNFFELNEDSIPADFEKVQAQLTYITRQIAGIWSTFPPWLWSIQKKFAEIPGSFSMA